MFPVPPEEIAKKTTDFLTGEMADRLAQAPVQFTLKMEIGDPGDDVNDPTAAWPVTRQKVKMGTLYVEELAEKRNIDVDRLSFNPMRLPSGIEASGDEILRARGDIYQLAATERGALVCPLRAGKGAAR